MKIVVVAFLLFLFQQTLSQPVIVYKKQTNFYCNFENVVRFFAKDLDCSQVVIKTDNGKIDQRDCRLFYLPERPGPTTLKFYRKSESTLKIIDSIQINVFANIDPRVYLGNKGGGVISKKMVLAFGGLIARIETNEGHEESIKLNGYTVVIHKKNGTIISERNTGNRYNEKLIRLLEELQTGEKLSFINIEVQLLDLREINARPIEFSIEEDVESKK